MGEHLRRVRLDRGLSQRQAAEVIGCHYGSLLNWERGRAPRRPAPSAAWFGKIYWEVEDMKAEIVRGLDPKIGSMYDKGGRESGFGERFTGMTDDYHTYDQQLGWHALFFVAGKLTRRSVQPRVADAARSGR